MIVIAAAGIEVRTTSRTLVSGSHVHRDAELFSAMATEDRLVIPHRDGPDLDGMIRQRLMTVLAGIVDTATHHLDRDDVES